MIYANNMKQHRAFIGLIAVLFWAAFAFNGCATQAEQSTSDAVVTAVVSELSPTAVVATAVPVATTATATAAPTITPTITSPTPTMVAATATATALAITPNPGWTWYEESEAPGILFQLPQTWDVRMFRPQRFQAPESNSIVEVRAFDFSGSDWLAWVQERESRLYEGLADGFVKQNGLVQGRPAFLFLKGGGGADAIALYIWDDDQIVSIYFQSGVLPRLEAERQILLTMIETMQFAAGGEGETTVPTGWVQGHMLTVYSLEHLEFDKELQTIMGTVETQADPSTQEAAIIDSEGSAYRVDSQGYYGLGSLPVPLRPFPNTHSLRDLIQPGQSLTLTGYQTSDGRFYPLWGQTAGADDETLVLYRPFFDLHRFDPTILAQYPVSVTLYLRGPWEQVQSYLVDEPDDLLPDSVLALDPAQDVIVKGTLQATAPPRLTVEEFYHLDGGK